ncbi:MAG TPA: hypothetical protein VHP34_07990, partial [Alphaproteobacteria bacterium]|nr:hypothetical protein [Alphaproteobacteria bacterium]
TSDAFLAPPSGGQDRTFTLSYPEKVKKIINMALFRACCGARLQGRAVKAAIPEILPCREYG